MVKYRINTLSALVLMAVCSSQVMAEPVTFETMHITATRIQQPFADSSRNISLISAEEIAQQQAASIPELIRYQPNIDISGGARASVQQVTIRGLSGDRVLSLVDGVRQNFVSGHRPTYFLEPELLSSIEVIRGPSSSLWGSGAMGGVISQNTKTASQLLGDKSLGGFVKQGWRTNDDRSVTTVALAGQTDNFGALVSGYYRDGNDLKLGNGDNLDASSMRNRGVMGKFDWQLTDAQKLTFNVRSAQDDGGIPSNGAATYSPNNTSNFLVRRRTDTDHASLNYRINPEDSWLNSQVLVYWNQTDMEEYRVSDGRGDVTRIKTIGLSLNNQSEWNGLRLLYGIDGYQDKLTSERGGTNRPIPPDATTDVWGAFAEVHLPFAERWQIELGGRYDTFRTKASNLDDSRRDNAFSPSVALVWKTTDAWTLGLRYDEAFRAPTAEELYTSGTHFCMGPMGCNTFLPDASLKAEKAHNLEVSASFDQSNVWRNGDTVRFSAALFRNHVDDFIEQFVDDPVFIPPMTLDPGHTYYRNVDKARLLGGEIAINYLIAGFDMGLSYGQTRAENRQTGEKLSGIPSDKWVAHLAHTWAPQQFTVGGRLTHAEAQKNLPQGINQDYDNYTLADIYATWRPQQVNGLKLDLTVNNLTNRHYRMAFQALHMQGRDIRLSATYDF